MVEVKSPSASYWPGLHSSVVVAARSSHVRDFWCPLRRGVVGVCGVVWVVLSVQGVKAVLAFEGLLRYRRRFFLRVRGIVVVVAVVVCAAQGRAHLGGEVKEEGKPSEDPKTRCASPHVVVAVVVVEVLLVAVVPS